MWKVRKVPGPGIRTFYELYKFTDNNETVYRGLRKYEKEAQDIADRLNAEERGKEPVQ